MSCAASGRGGCHPRRCRRSKSRSRLTRRGAWHTAIVTAEGSTRTTPNGLVKLLRPSASPAPLARPGGSSRGNCGWTRRRRRRKFRTALWRVQPCAESSVTHGSPYRLAIRPMRIREVAARCPWCRRPRAHRRAEPGQNGDSSTTSGGLPRVLATLQDLHRRPRAGHSRLWKSGGPTFVNFTTGRQEQNQNGKHASAGRQRPGRTAPIDA